MQHELELLQASKPFDGNVEVRLWLLPFIERIFFVAIKILTVLILSLKRPILEVRIVVSKVQHDRIQQVIGSTRKSNLHSTTSYKHPQP